MKRLPEDYEPLKELYIDAETKIVFLEKKISDLMIEKDRNDGLVEKYQRRYNASQESIQILADEKETLNQMFITMALEKKQWESDKLAQQSIIAHSVCNSDNNVSQLQNELIEIKRNIKQFIIDCTIDDKTLDRVKFWNKLKKFY